MHCGENGILKGTETAVDKYKNKAGKEQKELNSIDAEIAKYVSGNRNDNATLGYSEDTGFHYQIFSNKFCILYQNYTASDTKSVVFIDFPYEFVDTPVCQVTKTSATSSYNNIVVEPTKSQVRIDTNYGYNNKCSFAITIFGILK